ncbi:indole-3-glycerol phosphate synthase-domain-containing protein [Morchella snyderi]|nr:indole-3-glycerol phosphate synthase-domain-containing protein [Morchella snyderi]
MSIPTDPREPIPGSNVVLIDNYDSFTWNVYQFLVLEGAQCTVFRNDKITLQEVIDLNPTQIVISPGPGHPETDSGVSIPCIKHFAGKIPVFGVCMGVQCIFSAFGGTVSFAGEIVHGKTSHIKHDSKGIYRNVPQDIAVTRYHSLAGTLATLPSVLEINSKTESNVIMGVRHKEFTVEGIQYHPESILTEEGRLMIRNFLEMKGGTWKENESYATAGTTGSVPAQSSTSPQDAASGSILDRIYAHRRSAVAAQKLLPSQRPSDLETLHSLSISPPQVDLVSRLRSISTKCALMAEIKRASPSKGLIDIDASAAVQARTYALAGAAAISVLTEPEWFKGSIDDLRAARQAVDGMPNRPAILRKEFIFEEYQILEARLAGADTVLLIVKMLSDEELERLYKYSAETLGMEPLVEVNSSEEMKRALKIGAKVIGVNNRDLHSFKVDLETTSGLVGMIDKEKVILCALSGISTRDDVARYEKEGVGAVLVGEALMRAGKTVDVFINELLNEPVSAPAKAIELRPEVLVKICGTRTVEAAKVAVESGADMIGMILAEGTKRTVDLDAAKSISIVVHSTPKGGVKSSSAPSLSSSPITTAVDWFTHSKRSLISHPTRALLVGVFRNQPFSYVLQKQQELDLDIVQLHGSEPLEWARLLPVPVIRRFSPGEAGLDKRGLHAMPLLDSGVGGTGERLDVADIKKTLTEGAIKTPVMLAGGLNYRNVADVVGDEEGLVAMGVCGVDVSSGIETDGRQDLMKIRRFVYTAKGRVE